MLTESYIEGMEKDVCHSMNLSYEDTLSETMKYQLRNGGLTHTFCNVHQLQLYTLIKDEVGIRIKSLIPTYTSQRSYFYLKPPKHLFTQSRLVLDLQSDSQNRSTE